MRYCARWRMRMAANMLRDGKDNAKEGDAASDERHHKAAALAVQRFDGVLHALRRRRFEPVAEGEHALRHRARNDDAGVAEDIRRVVGLRPGHQHLRLRQEQRPQPVDLGIECHGFIARGRLDAVGGFAGAHQHHGSKHGKAEQPECERERGDLLAAHAGGALNGIDKV